MRPLSWTLLASKLSLALTPTSHAAEPVGFEGAMNWTQAAQYYQWDASHPLNPDNRIAHIPAAAMVSQLEPRLRLSATGLSAVARPRIRLIYEKIAARDQPDVPRARSEAKMREAFVQWTANERVSFTYGQQNFSWGATESLTPSNRIFHETALDRQLLYDAPGRHLARINVSFGRDVSVVLINEFAEIPDDRFLADQLFHPSSLAKGEISWNGGSDFLGIVLGNREQSSPWLGEYFNVTLPIGGLALFGDAAHQRGSEVWYPTSEEISSPSGAPQTITSFAQSRKHERKVHSLAVAGLRYDFENGATIRGEYVHNEAGYSRQEQKLMLSAFSLQDIQRISVLAPERLAENFSRAHARGLELPGKRHAFASLSWPKAFSKHDLNLYARGLFSLTDSSSSGYGAAEYAIGDAGTALASVSGSQGPRDGELRAMVHAAYTIGYRHAW